MLQKIITRLRELPGDSILLEAVKISLGNDPESCLQMILDQAKDNPAGAAEIFGAELLQMIIKFKTDSNGN